MATKPDTTGRQAVALARGLCIFPILLATGLAAWQFVLGNPLQAVLLFTLAIALRAWILGLQFVVMHVINRSHGDLSASIGQLLCAWWGESWACVAAFAWRHAWRSEAVVDNTPHGRGVTHAGARDDASESRRRPPSRAEPRRAEPRRGVLLVHGFLCNRGFWNAWMRRLADEDVPFIAVTMEPVLGSIDEYPPIIAAAVARLEQSTGLAPVVVAHSMGGLAVRRWWVEQPADRLHHLITLGTPHHGTWLGRWAHSTNGRQMRLNSRWLQALDLRERERAAPLLPEHDPRKRTTCFYSHCDNIVFPARTATLAGANNRHLAGMAHIQMIDHIEVHEAVSRALSGGQRSCPRSRLG